MAEVLAVAREPPTFSPLARFRQRMDPRRATRRGEGADQAPLPNRVQRGAGAEELGGNTVIRPEALPGGAPGAAPRSWELPLAPRIGRLATLSPEELARIASGYVSEEKYRVRVHVTETGGWRCELRPVPVSPPYVRLDHHGPSDIARLNRALAGGTSLGAWHGGLLVGIEVTERMEWNCNLVLGEFHVATSHRRQGIGRALMEQVFAAARSLGVRSVTAETQSTNMPAIRFYRACGFAIQGVDLSLYAADPLGKDREVAVFMRRFV